MTILKVKGKKVSSIEEKKLIGVFMPHSFSSYLSLYALTKKETKAVVLREVLEEWQERTSQIFPRDVLISFLAKKIQHEWEVAKMSRPEEALPEFRNELEQNLRNRGIDENVLAKIMLNLDNEKNEKTDSAQRADQT